MLHDVLETFCGPMPMDPDPTANAHRLGTFLIKMLNYKVEVSQQVPNRNPSPNPNQFFILGPSWLLVL